MTDRELLEYAAKAAGVFLTPETLAQALHGWEWEEDFEPRHEDGRGMSGTVLVYNYEGELSGTTREYWNPLTDDGDALRLAVKLRIGLGDRETSVTAFHKQSMSTGAVYIEEFGDPLAATRRAITRAAAEIGRAMP